MATVTGLAEDELESLVVLTGTATFKKEKPRNLVLRRELASYIRKFEVPRHSDAEVYAAVQAIEDARHERSAETDRAHRLSLTKAAANPLCPVCGSQMTVRVAKKGVNAGQQFLGCTNFPRCRGTRQLA
ncbi:topoisomerase DNA-binding C4 zinc finger domain-containing protein [Congregibacter litoralis]|uniref:Zn-finger domain protein associated with topoisomerase type I n=1 Tax=Congregibacter litoralis KT71 TaxID=314285 RepID=A4AB42_9GAMM|nr:Zn-finger domain protein associated with topoisomerase type I [Congregibacter litoralis KT71]